MVSRILELLRQRNLSQKQLAEGIGVSTGNISDWKSGRVKPSIEVLCRIADFFNVSVDYLVGRTDTPNTVELSEIYEIGVIRWMNDRAFTDEEKATLKDNFLEMLRLYKVVVNKLANYTYSDNRKLLISSNAPVEDRTLASCEAVQTDLTNLVRWVAAFPYDFNKSANPDGRDVTDLIRAISEKVSVLPDGVTAEKLQLGEDERDLLDILAMLDKSGRRVLLGAAEEQRQRMVAKAGETEAV